MSPRFQRLSILSGIAVVLAACDPNVLIGAKWSVQDAGAAGQVGVAGVGSGGGGGAGAGVGGAGAAAGSEAAAGAGAAAGEAGAPSAGAGGMPAVDEWCATAPWVNEPVLFTSEAGSAIPAGTYLITYVSGAQIHDLDIGYEVTDWYFGKNSLQAGHHVFSGESPEAGATTFWLDEEGITGSGGTIAEVEAANRGHTWQLPEHAGGELRITLYDDDYDDNSGPGTRFCIRPAPAAQ